MSKSKKFFMPIIVLVMLMVSICGVAFTNSGVAKAETVTLWNGDVRRFVSYETIDNAPAVSDRYYEGYAQGYIHGSTGADWQGE